MKHSKQRNVGILFEILNHAVLNEISKGHNKTAAGIFSVIKKNFMAETQISKAYRIYSQLLYSEARNPYYATRFYGNLIKEYEQTVNSQKLYNENSKLLEEISKVCDRKQIMKVSVPNYKLFASFNILINESGKVLFDEKPAKTREISRLVTDKLRQNDKMIFSVQTHSRTKYSDYIAVLDQLKIAKASRISIANPDQ